MKTRVVLSTLMVLSIALFAEEGAGLGVIPGASYYIKEGGERSIFNLSDSRTVTFFDADGTELAKLNYKECANSSRLLDPSASKPKIATYAIKWWPGLNCQQRVKIPVICKPGYYVVLMDKHGNYVDCLNYYPEQGFISDYGRKVYSIYELENFDMSDCVEGDSVQVVTRTPRKKIKK